MGGHLDGTFADGRERDVSDIMTLSVVKTVQVQQYINLLKPTGYVTHQQFNIQQLYCSAHTVFMGFVFIREQTATCATYSIN